MRLVVRLIRYLLMLALAGLVVIFAVANRAPVTLSLSPLPYEVTMPFFLVGSLLFMLGMVVACIALLAAWLRIKHDARQAKRRIDSLEGELASYRLREAEANNPV